VDDEVSRHVHFGRNGRHAARPRRRRYVGFHRSRPRSRAPAAARGSVSNASTGLLWCAQPRLRGQRPYKQTTHSYRRRTGESTTVSFAKTSAAVLPSPSRRLRN
jgi:hypothetical protein